MSEEAMPSHLDALRRIAKLVDGLEWQMTTPAAVAGLLQELLHELIRQEERKTP